MTRVGTAILLSGDKGLQKNAHDNEKTDAHEERRCKSSGIVATSFRLINPSDWQRRFELSFAAGVEGTLGSGAGRRINRPFATSSAPRGLLLEHRRFPS
jgi:hypothetical protein